MMAKERMTAIYARQSVDKTDSISIESQIDFCKYEARGEQCLVYIDRGFSGKDTNRPNLTELMNDIRRGKIHRVIVYKLDRISRSILDFSSMMVVFEQYGVEFVSSTERFDTSSPMGRAMLNICIVFAQLERETIQKRVADAYFARSRRGFYMGGAVPYGFMLESIYIDGKRTAKYAPLGEEADAVRLIYELYSKPGVSYGDIIAALNVKGTTKRGKAWERARIADILHNPVYVRADTEVYGYFVSHGADVADPPERFAGTNGCYCYKDKASAEQKPSRLFGSCIVLAPHEGLIAPSIWLACQERSERTRQPGISQKAKNTWLAGKIKCGRCGYALVDKRYKNSAARYLLCSHRMNSGACGGAGGLRTDDIESIVGDEIRRRLSEFSCLRCAEQAADPSLTSLHIELSSCEKEIASLVDRLASSGETLSRYINERVEQLDERREQLRRRLSARSAVSHGGKEITHHAVLWGQLSFDDRRAVLDRLIKVIRICDDRITIEWRI